MELNVKNVTQNQREAEVKLSWDEIRPYLEKAYKKFQAEAEIKGFRKGKAPLDLIKRLYGAQIEEDAIDDIVNDVYFKLLGEKKIEPLGTPELVDVDYKRGEFLYFKLKYEVIPDIQITNYKKLKIEKPVHIVDDKEVEDEIKRLLVANAKFEEDVEVKGELYRVTVDLQVLDENGLPVIGKRSENVVIDLDDEALVERLRERLLKARKDDEFKVELKVGEKFEDVRVIVKKIERKILPELNDEFAQKVTAGKVKSVDELKSYIKEQLQKWYDERGEMMVYDSIVSELVRTNDFEVPERLVEDFLQSMLDEEKAKYPDGKLPPDFDEQFFRQKRKADAVFSAKWYVIKNKIAEAEGIKLTDEDYEKLAEKDAIELGIEKEKLLAFYRTSEHIQEKLLNQKVLSFLRENAEIVEKFV